MTNLTLTAADSGTLFYLDGVGNFTLQTIAAGLIFGFYKRADANLVVTSPGSSDLIVAIGDAAADTVTFSTSSAKIGSAAVVMASKDLTKWLLFNVGGTTATPA